MIEMIGNGMALVDGIVFVIEQPTGTDLTDRTDGTDGTDSSAEDEGTGPETERICTDGNGMIRSADAGSDAAGESCQQVASKLNAEIPANVLIRKQRKGCVPDDELTPEQLSRRIYMRAAKRKQRAGVPRKNRPVGERTRAEQIRAAGRDYYRRHREEILLRRKALKEGAA